MKMGPASRAAGVLVAALLPMLSVVADEAPKPPRAPKAPQPTPKGLQGLRLTPASPRVLIQPVPAMGERRTIIARGHPMVVVQSDLSLYPMPVSRHDPRDYPITVVPEAPPAPQVEFNVPLPAPGTGSAAPDKR